MLIYARQAPGSGARPFPGGYSAAAFRYTEARLRGLGTELMETLNRDAAEAALGLGAAIHAATDVTGFGLLGHLREMVEATCDVSCALEAARVPLLPGARDFAEAGVDHDSAVVAAVDQRGIVAVLLEGADDAVELPGGRGRGRHEEVPTDVDLQRGILVLGQNVLVPRQVHQAMIVVKHGCRRRLQYGHFGFAHGDKPTSGGENPQRETRNSQRVALGNVTALICVTLSFSPDIQSRALPRYPVLSHDP